MKVKHKVFLVCISAALIAGCSRVTSIKYYDIHNFGEVTKLVHSNEILNITLPPSLMGQQMEYLLNEHSNNKIIYTNYHLWNKPLFESMNKILLSELNIKKRIIAPLNFMEINITIKNFALSNKRLAILSGDESICFKNKLIFSQKFSFTSPIKDNSYQSGVYSLSKNLFNLAKYTNSNINKISYFQ
ncbi:MAG: hypothetical protein R3Y52_02035 [Psittacicella sp.]